MTWLTHLATRTATKMKSTHVAWSTIGTIAVILSLCVVSEACVAASQKDEITDLEVMVLVADEATISWKYPEDVCYQDFKVTATALDSLGKETDDVTEFTTKLQSTMVPELKRGIPYKFDVAVNYGDDFFGASATKVATPFINCTTKGTPQKIEDFVVREQNGSSAEICWSVPANGGCIDEYTVGHRMKPSNDAEAFGESFQWQLSKKYQAGCHTFTGLTNERTYEYAIRGYNAATKKSGETTALTLYVADKWSCASVPTYYQLCSAAKKQECKPLDCEQIAANDMCNLPSVRKYDIQKKVVVQYCSMFCGCETPDEEELLNVDKLNNIAEDAIVSDDYACCNMSGGEE